MSTLIDLPVRVSLTTCRRLTATADTVDDDGESALLAFGALPAGDERGHDSRDHRQHHRRRPAGDGHPERTVVIPIAATPKGWDRFSSPLTNEMSFVGTLADGAASRMSRQQTHEMRSSE